MARKGAQTGIIREYFQDAAPSSPDAKRRKTLAAETNTCTLDILVTPHIFEKIFLYLDYKSFKNCLQVNKFKVWFDLQASKRFKRLGRHVWKENILEEERELHQSPKKEQTENHHPSRNKVDTSPLNQTHIQVHGNNRRPFCIENNGGQNHRVH